jgi:3'-5' exoribonuclease
LLASAGFEVHAPTGALPGEIFSPGPRFNRIRLFGKMSTVPATIESLKQQTVAERASASLHAQVDWVAAKQTKDQKPYLEILLRDSTASFLLRVWSDHPSYEFSCELRAGDFVEVRGDFSVSPSFGLEARYWTVRFLTATEKTDLLAGPASVQEKQRTDYSTIESYTTSIVDPRLRRLGLLFLQEFGDRMRRAAGARNYHHARRGGLVEHVAQMMRSIDAVAGVYPALNRDLLLAGVLFHDSGKLWENCFPRDSFIMPYEVRGELVGHVSIGVELVNRLWQRLKESEDFTQWSSLIPDSESVRLHLIHLVAAHHGEKQFGSPVEPRTPEAITLHLIDNLDAKLEMMFTAYQVGKRLSAEIVERVRPLPTNLVDPLPPFSKEEQAP